MASQKSIVDGVFYRVLETVRRDSVPVSNDVATQVADAVSKEIAPVVINAGNSEPWYQSRIIIGLLVAVAGWLGAKLGLVIGEGDVRELVDIVTSLIQAGGLGYAWYGRVVGARKKPLGQ